MVQDLGGLEQEVRRDPRMRRFHELAREYQRLGRLDEAAALCEKGLALHPSQWQARNLLAQIYLAKGRFDEARVQVEKVLLVLPDNVAANHLAAELYYALGDRERALRHYKIVDLFDPGRANVGERLRELEQGEEAPSPLSEASGAPAAEALMEEPPGEAPQESPPGAAPQEVFAEESAEESEKALSLEAPEAELLAEAGEEPLPAPEREPPGEARSVPTLAPASAETVKEPFPPAGAGGGPVAPGPQEASFLDLLEPEGGKEEAEAGTAPLEPSPLEDTEKDEVLLAADDTQEAVLELEGASSPGEGGEEVEPQAPAFNTVTLAQLYEEQGYPEKAVEVYQRILLREPENAEVREKVRLLLRRMAGEAPEAPAVHQEDVRRALRRKRIEVLEGWLRRVREGSHV